MRETRAAPRTNTHRVRPAASPHTPHRHFPVVFSLPQNPSADASFRETPGTRCTREDRVTTSHTLPLFNSNRVEHKYLRCTLMVGWSLTDGEEKKREPKSDTRQSSAFSYEGPRGAVSRVRAHTHEAASRQRFFFSPTDIRLAFEPAAEFQVWEAYDYPLSPSRPILNPPAQAKRGKPRYIVFFFSE